MLNLTYTPYTLRFKFAAGTSRGVLRCKQTYILKLTDSNRPNICGIGEVALFKGLSSEDNETFFPKLNELCKNISEERDTDLSEYSSIKFGLEQAKAGLLIDKPHIWFQSPFTEGKKTLTINGLVWMSDFENMIRQIDEKVHNGFRCIKLKIGAIDWQSEIEMIKHIRRKYSSSELEIRVDANGAFSSKNALSKLDELAKQGVHSIEQPIHAGQYEAMAKLCRCTALPIALDEELIGISKNESKRELLHFIQPQYIILKPTLCGGFSGAKEWIAEAEKTGTGWWITSALESNIGLTALAQWTATLNVSMPQGLGTGALFYNNFYTPLNLCGEQLNFNFPQ